MTAYAYLRKSSVRDPATDLGPETQERAIRDLARRHGHDNGALTVLSDIGISGTAKATHRRKGYLELVKAVEDGRASAVYSYSLSRLGRSLAELTKFFELCAGQKVPVRLVVDAVDTSTASGKLMANVLGSVAQFEADVASERVHERNATKLARGESLATNHPYGELPGEDLPAVMAAFREAGSFAGAARLLNDQGKVRPRRATSWWPTSVEKIVKRTDRSIAVQRKHRGARTEGAFRLARLLHCGTCGGILTGSYEGKHTRYYCSRQRQIPHARTSVMEKHILPAIVEEANHLAPPQAVTRRRGGVTDEAAVAAIENRRSRWIEMYADGTIDKATRDAHLARLAEDESKVLAHANLIVRPRFGFDWPGNDPRDMNRVLRGIFSAITVDPVTFQPVAFEWVDPAWRTDVEEVEPLTDARGRIIDPDYH
jgi:DNA invertase Pin-like site-specific DNA recombinase